jgi:hypothetical protein
MIIPIVFKYITYKNSSDILEQSQKLKIANNKKIKLLFMKDHNYKKLKYEYNDLFMIKIMLNCLEKQIILYKLVYN